MNRSHDGVSTVSKRAIESERSELSLILEQSKVQNVFDSTQQPSHENPPMFAEIHAKDFGKKDSEGQTLTMQGVRINTQIRAPEGLPFGEPRERLTLIIQGEMQEGTILRKLRLEMDCHEIETILRAAAIRN